MSERVTESIKLMAMGTGNKMEMGNGRQNGNCNGIIIVLHTCTTSIVPAHFQF